MNIYLIRHADSVCGNNLSEKEKDEIGLSNFGIYQAKALAKGLKKNKLEVIYSSPIKRASETASIVAKYLNLEVIFDDRLKEFCSDFEINDEIKQKELKIKSFNNKDLLMPSGESLNMAIDRLSELVQKIYENSKNKNVGIVCHRILIEGFLQRNFNIKKNGYNWLRNASVSVFKINNSYDINLLYYNKTLKDVSLLLQIIKRKISYLYK